MYVLGRQLHVSRPRSLVPALDVGEFLHQAYNHVRGFCEGFLAAGAAVWVSRLGHVLVN